MIYLDYNATAPILPSVQQTMTVELAEIGNPSSVHRYGVRAKQLLNKTRKKLADKFGAAPGHIVFTASGTEANALALHQSKNVLVEATAHPSLLNHPNVVDKIHVDKNGLIDLEDLTKKVNDHSQCIVSVMAANNETGVIQNIDSMRAIVHKNGGLLHIDASQSIGRMNVHFLNAQCDFMTVCFHKSGGPIGIAALMVHDIDCLKPLLYGGMQEQRRRAGTENMAAIAGINAYCDHSLTSVNHSDWEAELKGNVVAVSVNRLSNTSCIVMPGVKAETQVMAFDLEGIAISAGAACSSGKVGASHVLTAMQHPAADQAIRVSSGWKTTKDDFERFVETWHKIQQRCTG